jgi:hypothetical protein
MKKNIALGALLSLVPALLAMAPAAQAAECSNEHDAYVIAAIRADTWCSAASSPEIDAICAEKIATYDSAYSAYADCMAFDVPPRNP